MEFITGQTSEPGTMKKGLLEVWRAPTDEPEGVPLVVINGSKPGPVLAIDAMCHGDEPEGSLALLRLIREVSPDALSGTLVVTLALNPPGVQALQRGNPHDHWNGDMNRLFPGLASGNLSQRIANTYFQSVLKHCDYSISIHSGASYIIWSPEVLVSEGDDKGLELAKALGEDWDIVRRSKGFAGSCSQACNDEGITAISIEVGGAAERSLAEYPQRVDTIVRGLKNVMRTLGMLAGTATRAKSWTLVHENALRSSRSGFLLPEPDFALRRRVPGGTVLARLYDFYGNEVEEVKAPNEVIVQGYRAYSYAPAGWPLVWVATPVGVVSE